MTKELMIASIGMSFYKHVVFKEFKTYEIKK